MTKQRTITVTKSNNIKKLTITAMLAALSAVLMFFEFPLFFAPEFYKLDFSEFPVLIGTFILGPLAGVSIELVKILIKFVIKGSMTGGVGELANFLIGCSFILPAGLIYKYKKTRKSALIGMSAGTVTMAVFGAALNAFLLLPVYATAFHMPIDALVKMGTAINPAIDNLFTFCLLAVTPFNLLKGVLISILTFFLYKPLSVIIHGKVFNVTIK